MQVETSLILPCCTTRQYQANFEHLLITGITILDQQFLQL